MPDENIKTTLQFAADISDFKAAMSEANRAIKLANSEFKAASSGMDDWASSTDGLKAKLQQLADVQAAEEQKLAVLKTAYAQVVREQGENSKAAQDLLIKINNQQAAVNKAGQDYKKFSAKLDEVENAADDTGDALEDAGDAAEEAGKEAEKSGEGWTIVKDVIASLAKDAISWAVDKFKELLTAGDKALSTLGARTGATSGEMEKYRDVMNDIYRSNYGESFEDVSDAMGQVVQMFGDMDNASLENVTKKAIALRDTFDMDYKESLRAVNSLMDQFGISADEAFNLIVQGAQQGLNQNDDLLDTINEYSVQFKTAGYSADDMFNMLKNGADSGTWSVDKLGDAVKEFNIRAKDGTISEALVTYQKQLKLTDKDVAYLNTLMAQGGERGQKAYNIILERLGAVRNDTTQYQAGVALFGTMWEDLGATTVNSLMQTQGGISSTKTAMDEMANTRYDNLSDSFSALGRIIQTDLIQPLVNTLAPIAKEVVQWLIDNMPTIGPIITAVAAAFGVLATALAIQGLIKGIAAAFALLNATMLANPIVLIVAAIAGLVAAFAVLWNKSEAFRNFWTNLWQTVSNAVSTAWQGITNFFTKTIPQLITNIVNWFKELPGKIGSAIAGAVNKVKTWGTNVFNSFKTSITNTITNIVNWFKALPGKIGSAIVGAIETVKTWGTNVFNSFKTSITNTIKNIVNWFKALPGKIGSAIVGAIETVKTWGTNVFNAFKTSITNTISNIVTWFKQLPGKIWNAIIGAVESVAEWGKNLFAKGKEAASNLVTAIVDGVKSIPGKMLEVGKNLVSGLWEGIKNSFEWIKDKIKEWVGNVMDFIKRLFGIHSPSAVMRDEVGKMLGLGMAEGITKSKKNVQSAMNGLRGAVTGDFAPGSGQAGGIAPAGKTISLVQNNYSPKALSRREIYRQTHNALAFAGGAS